ncbi:fungal specific transcription factor domain-containing protein [Microdochium nivale]|nr:fungal specific transcription factor domain-containing protein [Microdochium nivale]
MTRHSKTRSGCRVCKRKRLKCDETAPSCLNCVRRGIDCPGYQKVLRWSTKHEFTKTSRDAVTTAAIAKSQASLPAWPPASAAIGLGVDASFVAYDTLCLDLMSASPLQPPCASSTSGRPATSVSTASLSPTSTDTYDASEFSIEAPQTAYAFASQGAATSIGSVDFDFYELQDGAYYFDIFEKDIISDPQFWIDCGTGTLSESSECSPMELAPTTPTISSSQVHHAPHLPPTSIPPVLHDLSTVLVEFWFHSVCDGWAAYDSPANPFRQLCSSLWTSSAPVFYSMQSMAAASIQLGQQQQQSQHFQLLLPEQIQEVLHGAPQMSTKALVHELDAFFRDQHAYATNTSSHMSLSSSSSPVAILVSLFCMSSSLSWIDARQLGTQYLRHARAVLDLLEISGKCAGSPPPSQKDKDLLQFFRGCLVYEEMLRSIVSDDEDDFRTLLTDWETRGDMSTPCSSPSGGRLGMADCQAQLSQLPLQLHPWTGFPSTVSQLFGKVMVVCRRSRALLRGSTQLDYKLMRTAMGHIQEARRLEERLLGIDVRTIIDCMNDGDDNEDSYDGRGLLCASTGRTSSGRWSLSSSSSSRSTTRHHLILATEAFRLCGLLQLYLTFPDLTAASLGELRMRHSVSLSSLEAPDNDGGNSAAIPGDRDGLSTTKATTTTGLALHIVDIIASIPASSGMRCLQPLLCIGAGTGLALASSKKSDALSHSGAGDYREQCDKVGQLVPVPPCHINWWEWFLPPAGLAEGVQLHDSDAGASEYAPVPFCDKTTPSMANDGSKVHSARMFLRSRVRELQQYLPQKPTGVVSELLEEVWSAMDRQSGAGGGYGSHVDDAATVPGDWGAGAGVHWLDIMGTGRFQSVFG